MATTTNYGWTTPDNTGYVKDGALAIRTLGSAIDTTVYGLNRVGQVVQATGSASFDTTSTSYVDVTSITASITPTKNTSKVLVIVNFDAQYNGPWTGTDISGVGYQIVRGSTSVFEALDWVNATALAASSINLRTRACMAYLDSPATTSATTYKLQAKLTNNAASVGTRNAWSIILQEVIV